MLTRAPIQEDGEEELKQTECRPVDYPKPNFYQDEVDTCTTPGAASGAMYKLKQFDMTSSYNIIAFATILCRRLSIRRVQT
jgi:hypothetical protein